MCIHTACAYDTAGAISKLMGAIAGKDEKQQGIIGVGRLRNISNEQKSQFVSG